MAVRDNHFRYFLVRCTLLVLINESVLFLCVASCSDTDVVEQFVEAECASSRLQRLCYARDADSEASQPQSSQRLEQQNQVRADLRLTFSMQFLMYICGFDRVRSGTIPVETYDMRQLQLLQLHHCDFSGTISDRIGLLSGLRVLTIYHNYFSGRLPVAQIEQLNLVRA